MKKYFLILCIFFGTYVLYFAMATHGTFRPIWALDYYNQLATSITHGRFDIVDPASTYDLSHYQGKWYLPWGILPALLLIPVQSIMHRYVPTIYLSLLSASMNVVLIWFLLRRLEREFFPSFTLGNRIVVMLFLAFGTTHFYVGTLGSVWHVNQMVSSAISTLSIYIILKKHRSPMDYLAAVILSGIQLLGRPTNVLFVLIPLTLYIFDTYHALKSGRLNNSIRESLVIFGIPLGLAMILFFSYNYVRFQNPFEYGYSFIVEAPYLSAIREKNGVFSLANASINAWHMLFEIPQLFLFPRIHLAFNLIGNSIFFLSPPLLFAFLASPFTGKKKLTFDPYKTSLWVTTVGIVIPILLCYSSGWMQFGYRYSLDFLLPMILLGVFGLKGRINKLYVTGVAFSIWMYSLGIVSLW